MDLSQMFRKLNTIARKREEYAVKEQEIMSNLEKEFWRRESDYDGSVARTLAVVINSYGLILALGVKEPWAENFGKVVRFISSFIGVRNVEGNKVFRRAFYFELIEPSIIVTRDDYEVLPPGKYLMLYDFETSDLVPVIIKEVKLFLISSRVKNPENYFLKKSGLDKNLLEYIVKYVRNSYYKGRGDVKPFVPVSLIKGIRLSKYSRGDGIIYMSYVHSED